GEVRYTPSDATSDEGELWLDWYDGAIEPEDAAEERVTLPISTRVLGSAVASLITPELNFGLATPGETVTLPIRVKNATTGDGILAIEPPTFDPTSSPAFDAAEGSGDTVYVNPGQTAEIDITFAPDEVDWYAGVVYLPTSDGANPQLVVSLLGTAIGEPRLVVVEPADDEPLDFGQVRVGESAERVVELRNTGGLPLEVTPALVGGDSLGITADVELGEPLDPLGPLASHRIRLTATPTEGGELTGTLRLLSDGPTMAQGEIALELYGLAPEGVVAPAAVSFGEVVQGWTAEAQTILITNGGTGDLTVTGVDFELGSSSQIQLADTPDLPRKLRAGDEPLAITVMLRADTLGSANAVLLVETDGVEAPILQANISGRVVSCAEGCPVANGTPSCSAGRCELGSCNPRFHDADEKLDNGCECREDGDSFVDVGGTCSAGVNVGPLGDGCSDHNDGWVERKGTIHSESDVDLYYFYAEDAGGVFCDTFGDSFKAQVQLQNAGPGVELCVRRVGGSGSCGGENQWTCGLTSWSHSGSYASDDNSWVTVWVRRAPGAAPTCGTYTVRFRGRE
ncbi:MAG: choice-of-anchor D domain-containing protein, partial [Myxococcota bacterium]